MENAANNLIRVIFVSGGSYLTRELWIAADIPQKESQFDSNEIAFSVGILLEGLPSGELSLQADAITHLERIAPGCFCCIGQLVMKVSLNRLIRQRPTVLYIAINDSTHLPTLLTSLSLAPYHALLKCENVMTL